MRKSRAGLLGSFKQVRALRTLERAAEQAGSHLTCPPAGVFGDALPPSTDWSHRPDLWTGPVNPSGHAPAANKAMIGDEVTLFHDCKTPEISLRQIATVVAENRVPFGLRMDIAGFAGSFLSLVIQAPTSLIEGLNKKHILRFTMKLTSQLPQEMSLRLNLKNGPNTERVSKKITATDDISVTEFDLAYVPFNESRAESIWFDLFFEDPAANQITLHDLTLSRRVRAEI